MYVKEKALRIIRFFELFLTLTVGDYQGKPFIPLPWERKFICDVYGTVDKRGRRLIREAYLEIPKKNGKSEFCAGLALSTLFADKEPSCEIYIVAASRDQAGIIFRAAEKMVNLKRALRERVRIHRAAKRIVLNSDTGSFIAILSSDADTGDGVNPHLVIFDEVHRQKSWDLYSIMRMGSDARAQPLLIGISTAGTQDDSPVCWDLHERAKEWLSGGLVDETFYAMVFDLKDPRKWRVKGRPGLARTPNEIHSGRYKSMWKRQPTGWFRANPSLEGNPGGFLDVSRVESDVKRALSTPSFLGDFLRFRFDIWTQTAEVWITQEAWRKCRKPIKADALKGSRCWIGGDLSTSIDVTALAFLFEIPGVKFKPVIWKYYLPEHEIERRSRKDKVPYAQWAAKGYITLTPGKTIDYQWIRRDIRELSGVFDVQTFTIDRWNASHISTEVAEDGTEVRMISQGFGEVSPAAKEVERIVLARELGHTDNPVSNWMMQCTATKSNASGDIILRKPDRKKHRKRIDGISALVNAMNGWLHSQAEGESVYNSSDRAEGILFI